MRQRDDGRTVDAILVSGGVAASKTGTGIAFYARTLASVLRSAGLHVALLFGRRLSRGKHGDAQACLARILGDALVERRAVRLARLGLIAFGACLTPMQQAKARLVDIGGVDLSAFDLPPFDQILNANGLDERADIFFRLRRQLTEVKVPSTIVAAHWTHPLPISARGVPNIYTLHDIIPVQFPQFVVDRGGYAVKLHAAIAQKADLIVTVSQASKEQIVKVLRVPEERVHVTYQPAPALPSIAQREAEQLVKDNYGALPQGYILFVGAIEPKKNLKRLIEAYLLSGIPIPLLIAGPLGWLYDDVAEFVDVAKRKKTALAATGTRTVSYLGYVPRRHVVALMQCARFLAFPSICEGFGLPVLEAMELGVPVLTSNATSLPEIAGDAAVLVDPLSVKEIAKGIRTLGYDGDMAAELVRRGKAQAAKFTVAAYRSRLAMAYRKIGLELQLDEPIETDGMVSRNMRHS